MALAPKVHNIKDVSVHALARKEALEKTLALVVLLDLAERGQTSFNGKAAVKAQVRPVSMPHICCAAPLSAAQAWRAHSTPENRLHAVTGSCSFLMT